MASLTDFYLLLYFVAALGSIITAGATWWLCAIVKKGLDQHVGMMEEICEEIRKSNRQVDNPAKTPVSPP